jgi:hypothetical protein
VWFNNPVGGFYQQGVIGHTNFYSSTSNIMKVAQFQVIEGTNSDPEFKIAGRDYGNELILCQRYYIQIPYTKHAGWARSTGNEFDGSGATLPAIMRAIPSPGTNTNMLLWNLHIPNYISVNPTTVTTIALSTHTYACNATYVTIGVGPTPSTLSGGPVTFDAEL